MSKDFLARNKKRIFMVGVDGADPYIFKKLIGEGKLPNFEKLVKGGVYGDLATTIPGVSPTAWTSYATGTNPGKHGILGFFAKMPNSYRLTLCLHDSVPDEDGIRAYKKTRCGKAFWELLSDEGKECAVLHLPATFPPDEIKGVMISGMGIPDLRETFGITTVYTTRESSFPGVETRLINKGKDGWMSSEIGGPVETQVPLYFRREGEKLKVSLDKGRSSSLVMGVGEWSKWVRVCFPIRAERTVEGVCQFKLLKLDSDEIRVLRTPVQPSPYAPVTPYTYPNQLAREIAENVGHYKILDRTEDGLDDDTFLEDVWQRLETKTQVTKYLMGKLDWDLFLTYFHTVDNVQHVTWKYYDPENPKHDPELARTYGKVVEESYERVDQKVGEIFDLLDEDVTIIISSDHGGTSILKTTHPNTWLYQNGYIKTLKGGKVDIPKGLTYHPQAEDSLPVDWANTKARAIGFGGIYLNVKGRDPEGAVTRGKEYLETRREIAEKLMQVRDPDTSEKIYKTILFKEQIWNGRFADQAADMTPILKKGYAVAWEDVYGEVLTNTPFIELFRGNWSGNHTGPYLPKDIAGIFIMKGPGIKKGAALDNVEMVDVAPTVLHLMGVRVPGDMDGKILSDSMRSK